jgi:hypothetical protein
MRERTKDLGQRVALVSAWLSLGPTQPTWIFENMNLSHKLSRLMIPFFTSLNLLAIAKFNKNFLKGVLASFCTCKVIAPLSWEPSEDTYQGY